MIKVVVTDDAARGALRRMMLALGDRRTPNRQLSAQLSSWVSRNFSTSGALADEPWAPLKPATIKAKRRQGYSTKPLIRTGVLRASFKGFYDNHSAGIRSDVFYAEFHENGVPENNLPARKMLPPKRVASEYATRIYGLYVESEARKAGL